MAGQDRHIMIVAGEASGDLHAAKLVNAIREAEDSREYHFFGCAGPNMRAAGVEPTVQADDLSIVGLIEIARALRIFLKARRRLLEAAKETKPDAVILVDFPDFNLKLAKALKKQGLTVIYYISPQVWAWRKYRIRAIRKYVDLLLTILPFEEAWFRKNGVEQVKYVGNPLAREVFAKQRKADFCHEHDLDPARPLVALLPGSRQKEIARILPVMIQAAAEVQLCSPEVQFAIAASSAGAKEQIVSGIDARSGNGGDVLRNAPVVENKTYDLLNAANAAAVTSGTATMEAGIIGTPLVVVYKTSRINYALLEPLISVDHYGLINLIAGERIATELIQDDFTPTSLSEELLRLLDDRTNADVREKLRQATEKLGHGGASKRAADLVVGLISGKE